MKIAIVGTAPLSHHHTPVDDPSWTIWACSPGNQGRLKRIDAWFELHGIDEMLSPQMREMTTRYFAWLRAQNFTVYMQEPNDYVPQAAVYPIKLMIEKFGRNWFTSSIAMMQALAIHQMQCSGITQGHEIGIFGVDMAATSEHYTAQKAASLRFIEIARERGITVTIPNDSCLGRHPPIYGYNEASHAGRRLSAMKQELQAKRAELAQQARMAELQTAHCDGALEQILYWERTWIDGADADLDLKHKPQVPASMNPRTDDFKASPGGVLMPRQSTPPSDLPAVKLNGAGHQTAADAAGLGADGLDAEHRAEG